MAVKAPESVKRVMNYQINFSTILIILIIAVGAKFGWDHYMNLKTELAITKQNNEALIDSVRTTTNKLDEAVYSKQVFVAKTQKDLKALNGDLAKTVRNFNGVVHEISQLEAKIDGLVGVIDDGGQVVDLPSGEKGITWSFNEKFDDDNYRELAGITRFNFNPNTDTFTPTTTEITRDLLNFKLTQGLRTTKDGKVEMFASSNYPGFTAQSLNSVIIDPKKHPALTKFTTEKKWSFGVYGGYGVTANLSTGLVNFGPQVGFGAMYKVF
jgi:hypothetical protein